MAHPLTQHPPSALPFGSAPRPSPLGFGFGYTLPSNSPFGSPSPGTFTPTGGSNHNSPNIGGGVGGSSSFSTTTTTTFGKTPLRPSTLFHNASTPTTITTTQSLKRPRKSPSPTPSSSPSPTSSSIGINSPRGSDRRLSWKGKEREDLLRVGRLDLGDLGGSSGLSGRRAVKKVRKATQDTESSGAKNDQEVDVGMMLATLPPSSHLQILLSLLKDDPTLRASVLAKLPQPDISDCQRELDKALEAIKRAYGLPFRGVNGPESSSDQVRAWNRVQGEIQTFCTTASTYLTFFKLPPNPPPHPHPSTSHTLLATLTRQIIFLLPLIPSSNTNTNNQPLLELAKRVIAHWTSWVSQLSEEVNKRGGMYPYTIVSSWDDTLDQLIASTSANPGGSGSLSGSASGLGGSNIWGTNNGSQTHERQPLMVAFHEALVPVRNSFINQLGWLIGRNVN